MTISIFNSVKPIPFVHTLGNLVDSNVKFAAVRVGKRRHEGQWDASQCDWTPWKYLSKPPLASSVG